MREIRKVKIRLSDREREERAFRAARLGAQVSVEKAKHKALGAQIKADEASVTKDMTAYRDGFEYQDREVEIEETKTTRRFRDPETGEILDEEPIAVGATRYLGAGVA
jgi:hypothetical protein